MVEWKKLGDVCEIKTGKGITQKDCSDEYSYPVMSGGQTPMGMYFQFNREANTTTISRVGAYAGFVSFVKEKFYCNDKCFSVIPKKQDVFDSRFLYVVLKHKEEIIKKLQSEGGVPTINTKKLGNILIPIPFIEEQQRIAGILDTFSFAIDNLKEQIAQRRKQFNWYLDKLYYATKADLLDASNKGEVIIKSFDEIGTFTRGRRFVRTDIVPEGVPCIHYGDMYTYYGVWADETPTHLTKERAEKLRFATKGDVVIVAAGENDLDIGVGVAWLGEEDVVIHDACFIFKHNMNPKYLSYFMRSMNYHQQIRMGVVDGKICSISAKELGRTLIAVTSSEEQSRIVSILDTFEASIANLEAQLSQREKQYEYYRNKLLTFD